MANLQDIVNRSEVGAIKPWTAAAAPDGYLLCNGAAVSRTTYADLFAVIGTTYGAGDSSTTFNVPQLQGKLPQGYDGNTYNLAGTGGANTVTVAVTNNQGATSTTTQSVTITGNIDNTSFPFYSTKDSPDTAWTDYDQKVIYAMKKGLELVLSGESSRGTITNDTYTLKGFTAAIKQLNNNC